MYIYNIYIYMPSHMSFSACNKNHSVVIVTRPSVEFDIIYLTFNSLIYTVTNNYTMSGIICFQQKPFNSWRRAHMKTLTMYYTRNNAVQNKTVMMRILIVKTVNSQNPCTPYDIDITLYFVEPHLYRWFTIFSMSGEHKANICVIAGWSQFTCDK